jgi:anti-anti-sigma regulatory factor
MNDLPFSEKDGYCIVHLPDHLCQNDWLAFRNLVNRQFIDHGRIHVIVDCEENDDLPSIAYGSLTSLSRDFHRINGSLYLVHVSES